MGQKYIARNFIYVITIGGHHKSVAYGKLPVSTDSWNKIKSFIYLTDVNHS